jgi:Zn-dependent oligopeptidase
MFHSFIKMLVADLYDAFKSVGFENKTAIKDLGLRYRDTFLKHGSSISSNEKFTMFRGRNPSMDPFIKSYLPKSK